MQIAVYYENNNLVLEYLGIFCKSFIKNTNILMQRQPLSSAINHGQD